MSEAKEKAAEKEVVEQETVANEVAPAAKKAASESKEGEESKENKEPKAAKEEKAPEAVEPEAKTEEVVAETPEPKAKPAEKVAEKAAPKTEAKADVKEKPAKKAKKEEVEAKPEKTEAPKSKKDYYTRNESEEEILKMEEPTEEFDWDADNTTGFSTEYKGSTREKMEEEYTSSLNTITEKEVVKATVVGLNDRDVILNIGFKSDGLVSATEFRDIPDLKIGDQVEIYIEEQENANGQLILSRRKAKIVNAWDNIKKGYEEDLVIEGVVKRRTKGGLIVDIFGVEAFLPGSQIDVKPIRDFDVFVNKKMEVKVVKINYSNDNVVVSHKVLIEKDLEKQKAEILNNLEKGQVLEGVIKNMTNFGVFIDLGGVDGLLHITDISWGRINHPEDVLELDATVKIVVLDFDEDKKRISLGMKQLTPHPWDALAKDLDIGSKVTGKIVNVADYGAFLEISPGVEGLIHVSEMSWSQHLRNPSDFLNVGDEKEAVVITLDRDERKMSLGIKQLSEDPWTKQDVLSKYGVGTTHKGVVRNLTNFGLFIELEEGIDGLVHVSDLSWTKKIKHPSEFVAVGDELEVKVLELDVDNRRLALGHKQLEDNPWDTFADVFTVGSVHKCTVISKLDKGALLELPYGLEGYANNRQLEKEDGTSLTEGDSADFKVLEFSKDDKRIVLSHTATFKEDKSKPAAPKKKASAVEKLNKSSEKDTLGDLDALSALKEQMETASKKESAKKVEPKAEEKPKATKAKTVKAKKEETVEEAKAEEVAEVKEEKKPKAKAKAKKEDAKEEEAKEDAKSDKK